LRRATIRSGSIRSAARREYLHLLEAKPDLPEAHHDLGYMDYLSGAHERAAAEYGRAVELSPGYAEALHGSCIAMARLGRCEKAAHACRRCLEVDPGEERCAASLRAALACP
jgi:Flp pilus assembly protein TadD